MLACNARMFFIHYAMMYTRLVVCHAIVLIRCCVQRAWPVIWRSAHGVPCLPVRLVIGQWSALVVRSRLMSWPIELDTLSVQCWATRGPRAPSPCYHHVELPRWHGMASLMATRTRLDAIWMDIQRPWHGDPYNPVDSFTRSIHPSIVAACLCIQSVIIL